MGVGHRVYRSYDPRARILGPLAKYLARQHPEIRPLHRIAVALEKEVARTLGKKGLFPNVDFYSGIVYKALGIPEKMFTPIFAVSRVSGWTARILEYLEHNRIFRPRVMYSGHLGRGYVPVCRRGRKKKAARKRRA
jgi:citrate synthase